MAARSIARRASRRGRYAALLSTFVSACIAILVPAIASACPVCAGRSDAAPWRGALLALFIFFPFALVYGVIRFIRAQARGDFTDDGAAGGDEAIH